MLVGVKLRRPSALVTLVLVGIGVVACGGSSTNAPSNLASLAISGCSPSGCSSPGASAAAEALAVKFSVCMRSHGVSGFPDPTVGSNGLPSWGPITTESPAEQAAQKAAQPVCRKGLPNIGPHTPAERATANAAALKYSRCMRSNGVPDFPDPNGQGLIRINAVGSLEPSSPAFQRAATACKSLENGFGEQSSVAQPAS
jgi:hypothetical protein